jgi:metal-responsive CopG/Arc/MetJ family transcriptional regulator
MFEERKEKISISIGSDILNRVNKAARKERRSRSSMIEIILSKHLENIEESKPTRPLARSIS